MSNERTKAKELVKLSSIPQLVSIQKMEFNGQNETLNRRNITFSEFFFVVEGEGVLHFNHEQQPLQKGDVILLNTGDSFRITAAEGKLAVYQCAIKNFHFSDLAVGNIIEHNAYRIVDMKKLHNKIESLLTDILIEDAQNKEGTIEIISCELVLLLTHIRRAYLNPDKQGNVSPVSMCRQLREYIDNNFGSPITLRSLADMFFVSPDYVSHVFKNEIGESPIHYLIGCRMREAKHLLVYTNMTLREISTIIGYDNMTHFSSLFKKSTGLSPGQYRQQERKKLSI